MKRVTGLLLLAVALLFGIAWADKHEGEPADTSAATEQSAPDAATEPEGDEAAEPAAEDAETTEDMGEDGDTAVADPDVEAQLDALVAEGFQPAPRDNELAQFFADREDTSIFLMLLDQAGLSDSLLEGDRPITIFAPNDSAFAKMDRLQFSTILNEPQALQALIERHIATDTFTTADLNERLATDQSVAGGGAGDAEVAAGAETEAEQAGAEEDSATAEQDAFFRVGTRAGDDIEVGMMAASERKAAAEMAAAEAEGEQVAGGGAGEAAEAEEAPTAEGGLFVDDARILEPDLTAGETTVHIVDTVLAPPPLEEEDQ
jgi:uncharacterized surface protein with fasciclin (FAS1) repeats